MSAQTEHDVARIETAWSELREALVNNGLVVHAIRQTRDIQRELLAIEKYLIERAGDAARFI